MGSIFGYENQCCTSDPFRLSKRVPRVRPSKPGPVPSTSLNAGIAFLAGLVSFVSPCVLPLVPAYLSFLTGSTVEELQTELSAQARTRVLLHSLAFIAGFTLIFVALGATASALGSVLRENQHLLARIGGIIIIVLGLQMTGLLKLKFLAMDKRLQFRSANRSLWASGIIGVAFAAGWSPCIGPILSGILVLASNTRSISQGVGLLFVYSLGLGLPFFVTALAIGAVLPSLNRIKRYLGAIEIAAGVLLIIVGIVFATDSFLRVQGRLNFGFTPSL